MEKSDNQSDHLRVAILSEFTHIAGRNTVKGVMKYARENTKWEIEYPPHPIDSNISSWLDEWKGDGIIIRLFSPTIVKQVQRFGIPVVNTLGGSIDSNPVERNIRPADEGIGRKAAAYFLQKGFNQFAFLGMTNEVWSTNRQFGYMSALAEKGFRPEIMELPNIYAPDVKISWNETDSTLTDWAATLPKFCAVFCINDDLGCYFTELCKKAGIRIPHDMAILGVDNDVFRCELCRPPLSSINPNHHEVGYQAAALLDRLMHNKAPEVPVRYVPCGNIVERTSSDILATNDLSLQKAVSYIRENLAGNITIDDVAEHAFLSRSVLQRRFKSAFKQTIHQWIVQERVRSAQKLLTETELSLAMVAEKSGFTDQAHMGKTFKKSLEITPLAYRNAHRHNQG